jgi:16S rRNA (guanine966-N2)-methyltransferase
MRSGKGTGPVKEVRPTSGKVLQALFNILGDKVLEGGFLDLFAGTGQVAFEAWRRGARPVLAVEVLRNRCERLRENRRGETGPGVLYMDVRRALVLLVKRKSLFSVVFADPPYGNGWIPVLFDLQAQITKLLLPGGLFVVEHSAREPYPETSPGWNTESRTYGETVLTFLRRDESETS